MSQVKVKTSGKLLMIALVLGGIFAAKVLWWDKRPRAQTQTITVDKMQLPDEPESSFTGEATKFAFPSDQIGRAHV